MSEFVKVASVNEIPAGEKRLVTVGSDEVVLVNLDGQFFALADLCTHDGGTLAGGRLQDGTLVCPRHGARFDVRTGAALGMPAFEPVPCYRVRLEGSDILVEVD